MVYYGGRMRLRCDCAGSTSIIHIYTQLIYTLHTTHTCTYIKV